MFRALFLLVVFLLPLLGEVALRVQDVPRLMQEIFDQHVTRKKMNKELMREALQNYVQQFDEERLYLLQREVEPFLNPSDLELATYVSAYNQGRFVVFASLDGLIQRGVKRARRHRALLASQPEKLFYAERPSPHSHQTFAQNKQELRRRIKEDMLSFIRAQEMRYGVKSVAEKKTQVLSRYEAEVREKEEAYLPTSEDPEHQFAMHVLRAIARGLDSHTRIFNASEARDMRSRLLKGYVGTGLAFEMGIDGVAVTRILPGSPAANAGSIEPKDVLLSIDNQDLNSLSFSQAMKLLEGDAGDAVRLSFKKPSGRKYQVTLQRKEIFLQGDRVKTDFVPFDGGIIGKIKLNSFYRNDRGVSSEVDVKKALEELREKGDLRGLVLDLRDNAGGYLSEAVKVAGLFISNGVIVMSQYHSGERNYYRDIDGKTFYDGPLVVLISRTTASAAEIVAQALQDYGVAVIAGDDRSYGKGSIQSQNVTDSDAASYYKVTVGKYYTVSGKTPQVQGVASDVVIPGHRVYQNIGEQFTADALATDVIEPAFEDELQDVRPEARRWFVRYYLPTLQRKHTSWQRMIPELKSRSATRLNSLPKQQGFTPRQQMSEALNIVRDMVQLRKQNYSGQVGSYRDN